MNTLQYFLIAVIIIGLFVMFYITNMANTPNKANNLTGKTSNTQPSSQSNVESTKSADSDVNNIGSAKIELIDESNDGNVNSFFGRTFDVKNGRIFLSKSKDDWYNYEKLNESDRQKLLKLLDNYIPIDPEETNVDRTISITNNDIQMYLTNSKGIEMVYNFGDGMANDKKTIIDTVRSVDHWQNYGNDNSDNGVQDFDDNNYYKISDWKKLEEEWNELHKKEYNELQR